MFSPKRLALLYFCGPVGRRALAIRIVCVREKNGCFPVSYEFVYSAVLRLQTEWVSCDCVTIKFLRKDVAIVVVIAIHLVFIGEFRN